MVTEEVKSLRNGPDKLGEGEVESEKAQIRSRRRNISVRQIKTVGGKMKEEIKRIFTKRMMAIGGWRLILELESVENKIEIMKRKSKLKGINLWMDDDYTEREKEIERWFDGIKEEKRRREVDIQVGYKRIRIKRDWLECIEEWGCGIVIKGIKTKEGSSLSIVIAYINENVEIVLRELKQLVECLKEEGEQIIENEDTKGDWKWKQTFLRSESHLVLDLVLEVEDEEASLVEKLIVRGRIESDHLPVEIEVKIGSWEKSGGKEEEGAQKKKRNRGRRRKEGSQEPGGDVEGEAEARKEKDLVGLNGDIEIEEVEKALKVMRNRKAAEGDGFGAEFLKNLPKGWTEELTGLLKELRGTSQRVERNKEGDEMEVKNYRGVTLLNVGYKLLTNVIASMLRSWLEKNGKIG
ncbi:hypothetical protein M0802_012320 [Mischocyttarus mexicanus]|nr:hypothetical protein M0802_012320 [Mischocyttarus mexicanus]